MTTPTKFHRRSIRLQGYDYTQSGAYFVTVCANERFVFVCRGEACLALNTESNSNINSTDDNLATQIRATQIRATQIRATQIRATQIRATQIRATHASPLQTNSDSANIFGHIACGKMICSAVGRIVEECLRAVPDHFPSVILDEYVVMPNHVHSILVLNAETSPVCRGEACLALNSKSPLQTNPRLKPKSLGAVVGAFKSAVSKQVNEMGGATGVSIWQRNFYEHIIRNDDELNRIREYILTNPASWDSDENNLNRRGNPHPAGGTRAGGPPCPP